jgi:hypothetical protein
MIDLIDRLKTPVTPGTTRGIPLDQVTLPADFPVLGDLTYEDFCRQFCNTFNLMTWIEAYDDPYARIGIAGLKKLHAQYQDRVTRNQVNSRRMNTLAALSALALASAGLDKAVEHDWDQVGLQWAEDTYAEVTDQPFCRARHQILFDLSRACGFTQNNIDMASTTMLMNCHAEGYVLTECRGGTVYKPRPYQDHPVDGCTWETFQTGVDEEGKPEMHSYRSGACGEAFFELDGYHSYNWAPKTPGKIEDTYWYSGRYRYHPVSPSAEELCVEKKTGVYIAPIVPVERDQDLPATCRAAGVLPVMNH